MTRTWCSECGGPTERESATGCYRFVRPHKYGFSVYATGTGFMVMAHTPGGTGPWFGFLGPFFCYADACLVADRFNIIHPTMVDDRSDRAAATDD